MAAVLAAGCDAALGFRAAGALWLIRESGRIEVTCPRKRVAHGRRERRGVVAVAVEKRLGVPTTPLASALSTSSATRCACVRPAQVVPQAVGVAPEVLGVAAKIVGRELVLVAEQRVVNRPERALRGGCLRGRRGDLRGGVDVVEGQVSPDVAQIRASRPATRKNSVISPR